MRRLIKFLLYSEFRCWKCKLWYIFHWKTGYDKPICRRCKKKIWKNKHKLPPFNNVARFKA